MKYLPDHSTFARPQLALAIWTTALAVGAVLLFRFIPHTDIWFSDLFYDAERGFFLKDSPPVQFSYQLFRTLPYLVVPAILWLLFASWFWARETERSPRRALVFLCVTLILGPGLLVNEVLKKDSGRARPSQIEHFGGSKQFTPALVIADQCEKNCSFVSGHASMGFFFIALAWALENRRWLLYGTLIGSLCGLGRIVEGAHFLSDVVFSLIVVVLTTLLCARLILGRWRPEPAGGSAGRKDTTGTSARNHDGSLPPRA